ncbi:MAG: biotin--[acetyl-CoA-carboxylase] ligase [Candidatus Bathyarchaeia archaeon]
MTTAKRLEDCLRTNILGRTIVRFVEVDSTSNAARALAKRGYGDGTVVLAEVQTAGRGREGRRWHSPRGGLWMSILLRSKPRDIAPSLLSLAAGVAVAKGIRRQLGVEASLTWPHDVRIHSRKVCGILAEAFKPEDEQFIILGIGINAEGSTAAYPEELRTDAITLEEAAGVKIDKDAITASVLEELERFYPQIITNEETASSMLEEWRRSSFMLGKAVTVEIGEEKLVGVAENVEEDGALLVRLEDGSHHHIVSGSVTVN